MDLVHGPTLHLFCGKIASGKSTLARRLAARPATLLISEDHWTSNLFADDLKTIEDYTRFKQRLRDRNAGGEHPFQVGEADYDLFTRYFVPPGPGEGFNVVVHTP